VCNVIINLYFFVVYLNILITFIMGMNGRYFNIRKPLFHVQIIICVCVAASTKRGKSVTLKTISDYNW
jgi:hypothetical protein